MSTTPTDDNWRRAATGRVWIAATLTVMDLALLLLAALGWYYAAQLIPVQPTDGLAVLTVFSAAGAATQALTGAANYTALRTHRTGQPPIRATRLTTIALWLAAVRLLALIATITWLLAALGLVETDPSDLCMFTMATLDAVTAVALVLRTGTSLRQQIST